VASFTARSGTTCERPAGPAPKQLQIAQARAGLKILWPTTPPR